MLDALAALDEQWTAEHLDDAEFHPEGRKKGSDYNQHYLEQEATAEQLDELFGETRTILGLDPETGLRPE